jgi:hypothetical protein
MQKWEFQQKQSLPYEAKLIHAERVARDFEDWVIENGRNPCVSLGGLDSLTLWAFLQRLGIKATPVSVSSLEDVSIQRIHKQIPGIVILKPLKTKVQVIREFGYPIISKEKAGKIAKLQNPTEKNTTVRNAIMTGDTGEYGGWRTGTKMKLPQNGWNFLLVQRMKHMEQTTRLRLSKYRTSVATTLKKNLA